MNSAVMIKRFQKNHDSGNSTHPDKSIESLAQNENEKVSLAMVSQAIAKVTKKDDLLAIINTQLKSLLHFSHCSIFLLSEDRNILLPFLVHHEMTTVDPEFQQLIAKRPVDHAIYKDMIENEGPLFFNLKSLLSATGEPESIWRKYTYGSIEMASVKLNLSDGKTAVLIFDTDKKNTLDENCRSVLNIISALIAVAVGNVLSCEKNQHQLREINGYNFRLEEENQYLQEQIETKHNYTEIVGIGKEMQKVFYLMSQVAASNSTVLILGETGTGKELIARAIHNGSKRKDKLMVKVNCAALPANLIESELFGHEKGSFTGATERRLGKFELANNGTLFLDEIGEMPLDLQVKLLRALQEREIERVGGKGTIKVNVRIISATNKDLQKEVSAGNFRSDLFYRLNVFPILLPPLRNREDDIPLLAARFIERYAKNCGKKIIGISRKAQHDLSSYHWPGNVRELEHLIERSILLTDGNTIKEIYLPRQEATEPAVVLSDCDHIKTIEENERDHVLKVIRKCKGKISGYGGAAELLGVPPSTLNSKIKKLGITKSQMTDYTDHGQCAR